MKNSFKQSVGFWGSKLKEVIISASLSAVVAGTVMGQNAHTIHASYATQQPAGPNSNFSINLTMSPSDVDIVGFDISVGYDNTQATLLAVVDNTGQPQADVEYTVGAEQPLGGVPYANVFRPIVMSVLSELFTPQNLARLDFQTTANYNLPDNEFCLYLTGWSNSGGPGGLAANLDGSWVRLPTNYDSLEPESSVADWTLY